MLREANSNPSCAGRRLIVAASLFLLGHVAVAIEVGAVGAGEVVGAGVDYSGNAGRCHPLCGAIGYNEFGAGVRR